MECIRTFLIEDGNLLGLALLEQIEDIVTPYLDSTRQEIFATALTYLILNKQEKFMNTSNPEIKKLFGICPFHTLVQLKDVRLL